MHSARALRFRFISLLLPLLLLLLASSAAVVAQLQAECNANSCAPYQGNTCDVCALTNSCATAYYSVAGVSCGNATLTVDGRVTVRRAQCCPLAYDGESEFVCLREQHAQDGGTANGFSCVKISAMERVLRGALPVAAVVCAFVFIALSVCVWRYCVKVPAEQQLPQYAQPLVGAAQPSDAVQPQPAYQPPAPTASVAE